MMIYQSRCLRYLTNEFYMVCFQIFGNILTSLQFMKKDKNIVWKITDQFLSLPIFGKILQKIIPSQVFQFLEENKLFTPNKSLFCLNDSCGNQFRSFVQNIYPGFDCNLSLEVRTNFLNIASW